MNEIKQDLVESLHLVASFLARRDVPDLSTQSLGGSADILVLAGSSLLDSVHTAKKALERGCASHLVISGGIGHSTQDLRDAVSSHPLFQTVDTKDRAEADILRDILTDNLGIDSRLITVENKSTNCGSNATESKKIIDDLGIQAHKIIVIQDPTMQRRSQATFERAWEGSESTEIISFSPFIPRVEQAKDGEVTVIGDKEPAWPLDRFVSLLLGEIIRLRDDESGYGPKGRGYISHIEIPDNVLEAYSHIDREFNGLTRTPNS
jgi:hypothetical protein